MFKKHIDSSLRKLLRFYFWERKETTDGWYQYIRDILHNFIRDVPK